MKYNRILLKLSGESLAGAQGTGIDAGRLASYARQIKEIADQGVEIGIVIGGGNIFRGLAGASKGFDRVKGDQMGMLATTINSLALSCALENAGQKVCMLTAIAMHPIGEHYSKHRALEAMSRGCAILGSIVGGIPEIVPPENCFAKKNVQGLKQLLTGYTTEKMEREALRNIEISNRFTQEKLTAIRDSFLSDFIQAVNNKNKDV